MKVSTLSLLFFMLLSNLLFSQEYVEINYKGREGVILYRSYFSDKYLQTHQVFNLKISEVYQFEKKLDELGIPYKSYVRKYEGIVKDDQKLISVKMLKNNTLHQYDNPNWKEDKTVYIHSCGIRGIIYNMLTDKIIYNKNYECE
ncbi:hypothetical protein DET49_10717 [Salegentibacter sp. 24]|uniref:hypothetical protein n=1 Tax=Salegentibacter sp. 24 TaxID=2183986 RepID=UPI0010610979|nr:hypothetical protein [Salegentibacter sp. 24]TDN89101.1 hypothetical protein DET49_10717 [Salegentibacter sp. 24]